MGERARGLSLGLGLLLLAGGAAPLFAQQPLLWDYLIPSLNPNKLDVRQYEVGCYDISSGRPGNCFMSFNAYFDSSWVPELELVDYTGGHLHPLPNGNDPARPVEALTCPAVPSPPGSKSFEGPTNRQLWTASKVVPQVSGVVTISAYYIAPSGSYFIPQPGWIVDHTPTGQSRITTFIGFKVGLGGLGELPSDPYHYIRCGIIEGCTQDNVDPKHPELFFATDAMIGAVQAMAFDFLKDYPDQRLRLSDMSLPVGGLCDINHDWLKPHNLHRVGQSMDVDPHYGNGGVVDDDTLDKVAHQHGLTRKEKEIGKIHYELGA